MTLKAMKKYGGYRIKVFCAVKKYPPFHKGIKHRKTAVPDRYGCSTSVECQWDSLYLLGGKLGKFHRQFGCGGKEKCSCPCQKLNSGHPAHIQSFHWLNYPDSKKENTGI